MAVTNPCHAALSFSGASIMGLCQKIRRVLLYSPPTVKVIFRLLLKRTVIPDEFDSTTEPLPFIISKTESPISINSPSNLFIKTPIRLIAMRKLHEFITTQMAKSWIVENILIAKYDDVDEDGNIVQVDCIYCTILRVAIIFFLAGGLFGAEFGIGPWPL